MNRLEYLLICLMEEAAEMQQAAAKVLRWGPNGEDANGRSNVRQLAMEMNDVTALMRLVNEESDELRLEWAKALADVGEKMERVRRLMEERERVEME